MPQSPDGPGPAAPRPEPPAAPRWPRRAALLLVCVPLAAAAGWWTAGRIDPFAGPPGPGGLIPDRARGELRYDPSRDTLADLGRSMLDRPAEAAAVPLNPARQPLDREPAGLPPFPPDTAPPATATHETRYRLADGAWADEVSFWRVTGADPAAITDAVAEHYHAAARAAGFTEITPQTGMTADSGRSSRVYIDPQPPHRTLTVRVREQSGGCHATIWLRYEIPTP
ncbi:MAG: hypothetical protein AAF333_04545 [Planctomycetota bacterium]